MLSPLLNCRRLPQQPTTAGFRRRHRSGFTGGCPCAWLRRGHVQRRGTPLTPRPHLRRRLCPPYRAAASSCASPAGAPAPGSAGSTFSATAPTSPSARTCVGSFAPDTARLLVRALRGQVRSDVADMDLGPSPLGGS